MASCKSSYIPLETLPPESVSPATFEVPFANTADISPSFSEKSPPFDNSIEKWSLSSDNLENGQYTTSEETITLPGSYQKMILQATWVRSAKTIYIGFLNIETEDVFTLSFVGGSITGVLNLNCLPTGDYQIILYGSDNKNTLAVMAYQFQ